MRQEDAIVGKRMRFTVPFTSLYHLLFLSFGTSESSAPRENAVKPKSLVERGGADSTSFLFFFNAWRLTEKSKNKKERRSGRGHAPHRRPMNTRRTTRQPDRGIETGGLPMPRRRKRLRRRPAHRGEDEDEDETAQGGDPPDATDRADGPTASCSVRSMRGPLRGADEHPFPIARSARLGTGRNDIPSQTVLFPRPCQGARARGQNGRRIQVGSTASPSPPPFASCARCGMRSNEHVEASGYYVSGGRTFCSRECCYRAEVEQDGG